MPKQIIPFVRVVCGIMFALLSTLSVIAFSCGWYVRNGWIMAGSIVWMAFMIFVDVLFIRSITLSEENNDEKDN